MFYAAMYALKGREDRRAASALQQMTGVDLGGQPGTSACRAPRAAHRAPHPALLAALRRAAAPRLEQRPAMRMLPAERAGAPRAARIATAGFCMPARLVCVQLIEGSQRQAVAQQEQQFHRRAQCRSRCHPS